jgi:hypothetical protein
VSERESERERESEEEGRRTGGGGRRGADTELKTKTVHVNAGNKYQLVTGILAVTIFKTLPKK